MSKWSKWEITEEKTDRIATREDMAEYVEIQEKEMEEVFDKFYFDRMMGHINEVKKSWSDLDRDQRLKYFESIKIDVENILEEHPKFTTSDYQAMSHLELWVRWRHNNRVKIKMLGSDEEESEAEPNEAPNWSIKCHEFFRNCKTFVKSIPSKIVKNSKKHSKN
ncbi:hypothetical protein GCK72_004506 [Caenorhabditis remanei]|uniref:Uncharacterized protein n=1 Tax=Caenorhabditis remanei TaxID=31234 RepID=A0A6A5HBK6_CAERE|nr:hypothetical protein GCK72_004506 [Caenorhabditis remanei]KAF1764557.1 hypothetical protein GCK72_004506 [Caenorhabditis remanei]